MRGRGDGEVAVNAYFAGFRRDSTRNKAEKRGFAGAILAHQRYFHPATHGKTDLLKKALVVPIFKRHFVKPNHHFISGHRIEDYPIFSKRGNNNLLIRKPTVSANKAPIGIDIYYLLVMLYDDYIKVASK